MLVLWFTFRVFPTLLEKGVYTLTFFDNQIWKATVIDAKGRCVLPLKLRQRLGLNGDSQLLWISIHQKPGKTNEFIIEVGVRK